MDDAEHREQGLHLLHQMLGPEQAGRVRRAWQEICPDFEEYVVRFLSGEVWSRPGLDRRTKSLVTIATLAALGRPLGLELNVRMALNNGAPPRRSSRPCSTSPPTPASPPAGRGWRWRTRCSRKGRGDAGQGLTPLVQGLTPPGY